MSALRSICIALSCALAGCDGGSMPDDASVTADVYVPTPECDEDADCDDGLYCTGVESCTNGRCTAERIDCDDAIECTTDVCIEERHRCEHQPIDADGDGFGAATCVDDRGDPIGTDCDDADANRFPGNPEVCDGEHDEDCDLDTRGAVDRDSDGYESDACCNPEITAGTPNCGDDCDDARASIRPLGTEVCDGLDQNCDGTPDDGVTVTGFVDADFDGRGGAAASEPFCRGTAGLSELGGDCDDTSFAISPDQPEICDGIRNDCTGEAADVGAGEVPWYEDLDGDGFGARLIERSCTPPPGASLRSSDCDDTVGSVSPASVELCDGIDNDCDGALDYRIGPNDGEDDDGDGFVDLACGAPFGVDCDDTDPVTGPGEPERCDGHDNDCDGIVDESASTFVYYFDADGDGYGSAASGTIVACTSSAGFVPFAGDCDDADPTRAPRAAERCNYADDDCDGTIDETPLDYCASPGVTDVFVGEVTDGGYSYVGPDNQLGQSFTVATTGQLVRLELELFRTREFGPDYAAIVELRDPSGSVAARRTISAYTIPASRLRLFRQTPSQMFVDFSSDDIVMTRGEVWSFWVAARGRTTCDTFRSDCVGFARTCFADSGCDVQFGLGQTADDVYSGGSQQCAPPSVCARDFMFKTVVRPPQ
jgi:hypothetical protein